MEQIEMPCLRRDGMKHRNVHTHSLTLSLTHANIEKVESIKPFDFTFYLPNNPQIYGSSNTITK